MFCAGYNHYFPLCFPFNPHPHGRFVAPHYSRPKVTFEGLSPAHFTPFPIMMVSELCNFARWGGGERKQLGARHILSLPAKKRLRLKRFDLTNGWSYRNFETSLETALKKGTFSYFIRNTKLLRFHSLNWTLTKMFSIVLPFFAQNASKNAKFRNLHEVTKCSLF